MNETATRERPGGDPAPPFSHEEEVALHAADVSAGRVVVCLLLGIFTIGLLMYLVICFSVG
jgi:hypothetical protein